MDLDIKNDTGISGLIPVQIPISSVLEISMYANGGNI